MDYRPYGTKLVTKNPGARTISAVINGQKIWFKQPVPPKARVWHFLQKLLSAMVPRPILRATVSKGGAEALYAETERLRAFKQAGFHVPDVLAVHDDMIIMTDMGPQFRDVLDKLGDRAAQAELLKLAIIEMARLHNAGLAHGRPYMRDMTWDGNRLAFLDLEEDPVKVMPIKTAQARDIWIFLSAASRFATVPGRTKHYRGRLIHDLLDTYLSATTPQVLLDLKDFIRLIAPLRKLLDRPLLWDHIGRDTRQSVYVTRCLEESLGLRSPSPREQNGDSCC